MMLDIYQHCKVIDARVPTQSGSRMCRTTLRLMRTNACPQDLLNIRPTGFLVGIHHAPVTMGSLVIDLVIDRLCLDHQVRSLTAVESSAQMRDQQIGCQLRRGYAEQRLAAVFHVSNQLITIGYLDLLVRESATRCFHKLARRSLTQSLMGTDLSQKCTVKQQHSVMRIFRLIQDAEVCTATFVVWLAGAARSRRCLCGHGNCDEKRTCDCVDGDRREQRSGQRASGQQASKASEMRSEL